MTRNSKKQICDLRKRRRRDPRIRTPLDRWSSDVWHDLINKRWLIIGIDWISDNRNPKSLSHYPRGNGELFTLYPTPNNGVRIIDVTWEVREELSNQSGWGWWSISKSDSQPLDSRLALMAGSTSSRITECSAQILCLLLSFSKASRARSFLNNWTLEGDIAGVEGTQLALVFLRMVLE